jgi:hypothetical protein
MKKTKRDMISSLTRREEKRRKKKRENGKKINCRK